MRLKKNIEEGRLDGEFRMYPLLDDKNNIAWPGKFPSLKEIEELKRTVGSKTAWQREYLLNPVAEEKQIILPEWIQYYDALPDFNSPDYKGTFIGIDPAIAESSTADYTAMVAASVFGEENNEAIYIHPFPVNERLSFFDTKERAMNLSKTLGKGKLATLIVEDVAYQKALIQELKRASYIVEAFKVNGMNKGSRLTTAASLLQEKKVFFPAHGSRELVQQILDFGTEKHDDLVDAFTLVLLKIINSKAATPGITLYYKEKVENAKKNPYDPKGLSFWQQMAKNGVPYGQFWQ